ncbi:MAG TPA: isoleucine--tRNA ligase [Candidatus Azosocius sp. HAIN]
MNVYYNDTLNLPKTKFKMKANLPINEPNIIMYWQNMDLYNFVKFNENDNINDVFIICDGPPYSNGFIHLGHALNKILKDIINKFKILEGKKIFYIPGWDCHGLPIELNVEKKIGIKSLNVKYEEFIISCRSYANYQVEKQKSSFIRLGILADWKNIYLTMNYKFESSIIDNLCKIIKNNHIYRGKKPVYWCIFCESALAEAEIEYFEKESKIIDVLFLVYDFDLIKLCYKSSFRNFFLFGYGNFNFVIWTTTSWTIPANEGVAINFEIIYVLIQIFNNRIIVAYDLLDSFLFRCKIIFYKLISKCFGKNFFNKILLIHPIINCIVPLIFSKHVNLDFGTGCVHIAPGHGYDDYILGIKYGFSIFSIIDKSGKCVLSGEFKNLSLDLLSNFVIKFLENSFSLLSNNYFIHSYPHCWRHKKPLIFRSTYQFFVSMEKKKLRKFSLESINFVNWYPNNGINRIKSMIETRPDWCISRQRIWGVPISLFMNKNSKIHPYTFFIFDKLFYLISKYGISIWRHHSISILLNDENYFQIFDILDVWFDSGSVYNYQKNFFNKLFFPLDLYLEGSDQHRGWFQTSLLLSNANEYIAPYKNVLTHGFVLDSFGNKMSKSLGNIITPEKLINDFGADILRLWVSSTNFQCDVNISLEILSRIVESYRKIRNTIKFLLSNIFDFEINNLISFKNMLKIDKWIVGYCINLQKSIIFDYNNYNFHGVYHKVQNFCINELGGFYLDIIKDRQYTCKKDGLIRRSSQTAIFYILKFIIKWISPILSFTSEEAWGYIPNNIEKSVFLSKWDNISDFIFFEKLSFDFWNIIFLIKNLVNQYLENYRKIFLIGSCLDLDIYLYCNIDLYLLLFKIKNELNFLFITSNSILKLIDNRFNYYYFYNFKFYIDIKKSVYFKCERCWHRVYSVKSDNYICSRCFLNLGSGEKRFYL